MSDVRLIVNGRRYGGWKSVRVTRSIESIAGSFALDVTDRWSDQAEPWAIAEEDACRVEIDGTVVIDGYVDRRSIALSSNQRTLGFTGRDKAGALVDCSTILDKWSYRGIGLLELARKIAQPFGITVSVQAGLVLPALSSKITINPGDSAYQAIERIAQIAGVIVVSDGAGGIVLTRTGTARAAALIVGQNVLDVSVEYDGTERYRRYVVATQIAGTDNASGDATRITAEATDEGVRRTDRVLMIRPDIIVAKDLAKRRGDWEARIRAARAETVAISVHGWKQANGQLWPVNSLVRVQAPQVGVNGDMLISQAEYAIGSDGEITQLRLVRPDAFTPEPQAVVRQASGTGKGLWKALTEGFQSIAEGGS